LSDNDRDHGLGFAVALLVLVLLVLLMSQAGTVRDSFNTTVYCIGYCSW